MIEAIKDKYTLGIDYGTLSVRTVLMNCRTGEAAATSTMAYPHAVQEVMKQSGVPKEDVIGLSDRLHVLHCGSVG